MIPIEVMLGAQIVDAFPIPEPTGPWAAEWPTPDRTDLSDGRCTHHASVCMIPGCDHTAEPQATLDASRARQPLNRPGLEIRQLGYVPPEKLKDSGGDGATVPIEDLPEGVEPNLVTSELGDGTHLPCVDIDFAARLIPSSTAGHFHLYLDGMEPLSWEKYDTLLSALAEAGVIERGFYNHSHTRKMTCLRRPGVLKEKELTI